MVFDALQVCMGVAQERSSVSVCGTRGRRKSEEWNVGVEERGRRCVGKRVGTGLQGGVAFDQKKKKRVRSAAACRCSGLSSISKTRFEGKIYLGASLATEELLDKKNVVGCLLASVTKNVQEGSPDGGNGPAWGRERRNFSDSGLGHTRHQIQSSLVHHCCPFTRCDRVWSVDSCL